MISAERLKFSYGKGRLIQNMDFTVHPGECVVLTGPNGSGKSTLLSLLAGTLKPDEGHISVKGTLGLIPQGTALFEDMSVQDNLKFFAGLAGVPVPKELPFSLDPYRKKRLSALSGGTKKRVSITCALLGEPRNILFDEPCAGLDILYQQELSDLILSLKQKGCCLLYVGHDPQEYVRFFDRLIFLGEDEPRYFEASLFASPSGESYETAMNVAATYRSLCEEVRNQHE